MFPEIDVVASVACPARDEVVLEHWSIRGGGEKILVKSYIQIARTSLQAKEVHVMVTTERSNSNLSNDAVHLRGPHVPKLEVAQMPEGLKVV